MTATSGPGWYLAPSLVNLLNEVNSVWPDRSTNIDGAKGDSAHSERDSEHNPNERGSVNALDLTNQGVDVDSIIEAASNHPSTMYIISRGLIYSDWMNFEPRSFPGDPHDRHVHISIKDSAQAENNTAPWGIEEEVVAISDADIKRIVDAVGADTSGRLQYVLKVLRGEGSTTRQAIENLDLESLKTDPIAVADAIVDGLGEQVATEVLDAMSQRLAI